MSVNDMESEVKRLAAESVEMLQERAGGVLDYTVRNLDMVEEILAEAADYFSELPQEQGTSIVQRVGCYVLDVAHRQFGGRFSDRSVFTRQNFPPRTPPHCVSSC
jgi:hypothetical protein